MIETHSIEHAPGVSLPKDEHLIRSVETRLRAYHAGKEQAVKSPRIEKALSIKGQKLRAIVNYLNSRGVWVASCGEGYFYAVTSEEREEYLASLRSRVKGINNRIDGLTS